MSVHCGECIPCLIRRIAIEAHATDSTKYARNLFSEDIAALPDDDEGRRNFADIADFVMRFGTLNNQDLVMDFPELISDHFDSTKAIEMYRQFGKEARKVLSGYRQRLDRSPEEVSVGVQELDGSHLEVVQYTVEELDGAMEEIRHLAARAMRLLGNA